MEQLEQKRNQRILQQELDFLAYQDLANRIDGYRNRSIESRRIVERQTQTICTLGGKINQVRQICLEDNGDLAKRIIDMIDNGSDSL
jgi:hypothetical protein